MFLSWVIHSLPFRHYWTWPQPPNGVNQYGKYMVRRVESGRGLTPLNLPRFASRNRKSASRKVRATKFTPDRESEDGSDREIEDGSDTIDNLIEAVRAARSSAEVVYDYNNAVRSQGGETAVDQIVLALDAFAADVASTLSPRSKLVGRAGSPLSRCSSSFVPLRVVLWSTEARKTDDTTQAMIVLYVLPRESTIDISPAPVASGRGTFILSRVVCGAVDVRTFLKSREVSKRRRGTSDGVYHAFGGTTRQLWWAHKNVEDTSPGDGSVSMVIEVELLPGLPMTRDYMFGGDSVRSLAITSAATRSAFLSADPTSAIVAPNNAAPVTTVGNSSYRDIGGGMVGGLDKELATIARRVLASRRLPAAEAAALGLRHVRGVLLHGPPGCGKTLLARQLANTLEAVDVQIVSGPAILDKYVGTSEERVRELFAPAEKAWRQKGPESGLHLIIFDEVDAIAKTRGTLAGDSSGVRDSVVNQLLAKIDGVESIDNVLVVGMTNRKDLIDEALLRPGRLEIHMKVGRPRDVAGRRAILDIHTAEMRARGRLGAPGQKFKSGNSFLDPVNVSLDTVAEKTAGCSGADLAGIVRLASSFALDRYFNRLDAAAGGVYESPWPYVTSEDFLQALAETLTNGPGGRPPWTGRAEREAAEEAAIEESSSTIALGGDNTEASIRNHEGLRGFLENIGLEVYAPLFESNAVGVAELAEILGGRKDNERVFSGADADGALARIGVPLLGHRLRIIAHRKELSRYT